MLRTCSRHETSAS